MVLKKMISFIPTVAVGSAILQMIGDSQMVSGLKGATQRRMNKKGQLIFLGIMIAIMAIIIIVQFIPLITEEVATARNETYLNCTNPEIPIGNRMTCTTIDLWVFLFVGVGFASAIAYMIYLSRRTY